MGRLGLASAGLAGGSEGCACVRASAAWCVWLAGLARGPTGVNVEAQPSYYVYRVRFSSVVWVGYIHVHTGSMDEEEEEEERVWVTYNCGFFE